MGMKDKIQVQQQGNVFTFGKSQTQRQARPGRSPAVAPVHFTIPKFRKAKQRRGPLVSNQFPPPESKAKQSEFTLSAWGNPCGQQ